MRGEEAAARRDPRWFRPPPLAARLTSLSAVVLLHDGEARVGPFTASLLHVLPAVARHYEVILVDDASRDRTGTLADEIARAQPALVRVLHCREDGGRAGALRAGIGAARHDHAFVTDGRSHPAQLRTFLAPFEHADLVVGYRRWGRGRLTRRIGTAAWSWVVRHALGLPVRDPASTCALVRRTALESVGFRSTSALTAAELLAQVARRGGRVVEVPVAPPGRTGVGPLPGPLAFVRAVVDLVRLRRHLARPFA